LTNYFSPGGGGSLPIFLELAMTEAQKAQIQAVIAAMKAQVAHLERMLKDEPTANLGTGDDPPPPPE